MQVILLEQISGLGSIGDVVSVKNGFGRNYLVPQGKALRATDSNKKEIEQRRVALEKQNNERKAEAEKRLKEFDGVVTTIVRQASEDGKLYGSVAVRDIAASLKEDGKQIDARMIDLLQPIKALGLHKVTVNLHAEVQAEVKVHVARNADSPIPEELLEEEKEEQTVVETVAEAVETAADAIVDPVTEAVEEAIEKLDNAVTTDEEKSA